MLCHLYRGDSPAHNPKNTVACTCNNLGSKTCTHLNGKERPAPRSDGQEVEVKEVPAGGSGLYGRASRQVAGCVRDAGASDCLADSLLVAATRGARVDDDA